MSTLGAKLGTETSLRIDPRIVLGSHLLRLNQVDLVQAIEAELAENPALEQLHDDLEPVQDEQIIQAVAPTRLKFEAEDYEFTRSSNDGDDLSDWVDFTPAPPALRDYLVAQLMCKLEGKHEYLAHYVVDSLDDRGYLPEPDEEIALDTGEDLDKVTFVVLTLRTCEPAGIGARNLMECLALQLNHVETVDQRLAKAILKTRLEDFMGRKADKLAKKFDVAVERIESAFDIIASLTPYPGQAYEMSNSHRQVRSIASPDVIYMRTDQGWQIEIKGPDAGTFQISRSYLKRAEELRTARHDEKDEKRHIQHYIQKANDFLYGLDQRKNTLRRVAEFLLARQSSFLNTGSYHFLQPLTRSQMAAEIGLHESTVSRATADKFVQLPTGSIVSFEVFFKPALRVQKMIEEILQRENPDNPLSDDRISEMLREQGVTVARRTVNKYRDRTKFLSSRKRRSA